MTHSERTAGVSRRRLVQGLAVAAGAVGLSGTGRAGAEAAVPAGAAEARIAVGRLVLTGVRWRALVVGAVPGQLPEPLAVPSTVGDLLLDGEHVGEFASAAVPGAGGRFLLHHFQLGHGTLLGMGSGSLAEGAFAIVGGTGRYAGAVGSYTASQRPGNRGGDGSAEFILDLTALEG